MSQNIRKRLAENLKEYRTKANLKREKLSLALGFDNSYISKLERKSINITLDKLSLLADYLNIDITELLKK